jgi:hypothetical protein
MDAFVAAERQQWQARRLLSLRFPWLLLLAIRYWFFFVFRPRPAEFL